MHHKYESCNCPIKFYFLLVFTQNKIKNLLQHITASNSLFTDPAFMFQIIRHHLHDAIVRFQVGYESTVQYLACKRNTPLDVSNN